MHYRKVFAARFWQLESSDQIYFGSSKLLRKKIVWQAVRRQDTSVFYIPHAAEPNKVCQVVHISSQTGKLTSLRQWSVWRH